MPRSFVRKSTSVEQRIEELTEFKPGTEIR